MLEKLWARGSEDDVIDIKQQVSRCHGGRQTTKRPT
jgi:hypothetical protein